jgi:hypothetical protein
VAVAMAVEEQAAEALEAEARARVGVERAAVVTAVEEEAEGGLAEVELAAEETAAGELGAAARAVVYMEAEALEVAG